MLPLAGDVKRSYVYRITDLGREVLFKSATAGSSLRTKKTHEEQVEELRVLDYLANRESASQGSLRAAIGGRPAVVPPPPPQHTGITRRLAYPRSTRPPGPISRRSQHQPAAAL